MKTPQYIVEPYNLPRGRAVGRGKVAEAALTAEAEVPHAALAAQAAVGRMGVRKGGAFLGPPALEFDTLLGSVCGAQRVDSSSLPRPGQLAR
jgi:hypothetical protein